MRIEVRKHGLKGLKGANLVERTPQSPKKLSLREITVPTITYVDPSSGQKKSIAIQDGDSLITLGRNQSNDVRIDNPSISRQHARLEMSNGVVTLHDLGSSNGTFHNGKRVMKVVLSHQDIVLLGEIEMVFYDVPADAPTGVQASGSTSIGQGTSLGDDGISSELDHPPLLERPLSDSINFLPEESADYQVVTDSQIMDGGDKGFSYGPPPSVSAESLGLEGQVVPPPNQESAPVARTTLGGAPPVLPKSFGGPPPINRGIVSDTEEKPWYDHVHSADEPDAEKHDPAESKSELEQLRQERDRLLDLVQGRANDVPQEISAQLRRLRTERDQLINERRQQNEEVLMLKAELEKSPKEEDLKELQGEVDKLNNELGESKKEVEQLQQDLEIEQKATDDLEQKLREKGESGEDLESLRLELESSRTQLGDLQELQADLETHLEEARATVEELKKEVAVKSSKIDELESCGQVKDGEVGTPDGQEELRKKVEELNLELERLREVHHSLEVSNETLKGALEDRPNQLEYQELADELEQVRTGLLKVRSERDVLIRERDDLLKLKDENELRLAELEQRAKQVGARLDVITTERDTLKQEKIAFARETDYLQIERKRLHDEAQKLRESVRDAGKDARQKKRIFDELSSDLRQLVAQNNQLTEELNNVNALLEVAPKQSEHDQLADEVQLLKDRNLELEEEVSAATRDLGTVSQEKQGLHAKIESLEAELEQLRESASSDEAIQSQLVELKHKVRQDAEEIQSLECRIKEATHDLTTLRRAMELKELDLESKGKEIARLEAVIESNDPEGVSHLQELNERLKETERQLFELIKKKDVLDDRVQEYERQLGILHDEPVEGVAEEE